MRMTSPRDSASRAAASALALTDVPAWLVLNGAPRVSLLCDDPLEAVEIKIVER
jgi:hypothetical protein